ncbi:uncharacterized protein LOC109837506 [Asparagus officinalis]|uniref:uncharacterized protein LOC109837506 n=1 Tax=Asparagus officinalis TaxID=4686 RepID=UPI00098E69E3|nr:uncharacterized protein LOC109837506 [Asparagus officinalis]
MMSIDPVPSSNSHGNLDEQITQLMQCKPLSKHEVISITLYSGIISSLSIVWFNGSSSAKNELRRSCFARFWLGEHERIVGVICKSSGQGKGIAYGDSGFKQAE